MATENDVNVNEKEENVSDQNNVFSPEILAELTSKIEQNANQNAQLISQNQALQTELDQIRKNKDEESLRDAADLKKILSQEADSLNAKSENSLDNLSNEQMIDVMANALEQSVEAKFEMFSKKSKEAQSPQNEQMNQITQALGGILAKLDMGEVQGKYKDFGEYSAEVGQMIQNHPSLSMEDAYVLVKAKKSQGVAPANIMDTERPDNVASRTGRIEKYNLTRDSKAGSRSGSLNFKEMCRAAAEKAMSIER